jgi:Lon protease-like protein
MSIMPQFPLGLVLFPSMVLPLHVFEPRYRTMVQQVLASDGRFGVVLIERGREVGGGDARTNLGTVAQVVEAEQFSDGRWALTTVGVERFRVNQWLPDDPYPVADVELWPDEELTSDLEPAYRAVLAKFRRCMALASESGVNVGPLPADVADVELGCMQIAALSPLPTIDKQALLAAPGPADRLPMLDRLLDEALALILLRLTES